jgi:2-oxoglutarate ferredoxin oxidoreductase subunit alpha
MNAELPLVIVDSQRGGPSTGLPTKTEQSDLYLAVYGRNADAPLPVISASTPSDCFEVAIEAVRIALRHMTPVFLMTDGYLANAAEPWRLPDMDEFEPITVKRMTADEKDRAHLFKRDAETLARSWVPPGTPNLMHRIGGLEKDINTGNISYDAANHQAMTRLRAEKVERVADFIPDQTVERGPDEGRVALVGWGSTYGAIYQAVRQIERTEAGVSHIHVRYINPLPKNFGELLSRFDKVIVPEMNNGQFATVLRDKVGIEPIQFNKVSGLPFSVAEIVKFVKAVLGGEHGANVVQMAQGDRS